MYENEQVLAFRPPRIAMSLILLAAFAHVAIPFELHRNLPVAAAVTGATGLLIMLRAWWLFKVAGTAICPTDETSTFITNDIFSISRNPMYLGMTLMLIATAMFVGTLSFYVAALANFAILNRHFCPYEENKLRSQYGARFEDYASRVRRWL